MKKIILFLSPFLLFAGLLLLVSCSTSTKEECITPPEIWLRFKTIDSSNHSTDTSITIAEYRVGSGFAITDSILPEWKVYLYQNIVPIQTHYLSTDFNAHDWIFTFKPSGKQYRIRDIRHIQVSQKIEADQRSNGVKCTNDLFYTINDIQYKVKGDLNINSGLRYEDISIIY